VESALLDHTLIERLEDALSVLLILLQQVHLEMIIAAYVLLGSFGISIPKLVRHVL
jgi:hypothetical protein